LQLGRLVFEFCKGYLYMQYPPGDDSPDKGFTQSPMGIPIGTEIQRVKMEIEQRRLQLGLVNASISSVNEHYEQNHVHRGGPFGDFVRAVQQSSKNSELRQQQPIKERLQREKIVLGQQLSRLKILKAQGITHVDQMPPVQADVTPTKQSGNARLRTLWFIFLGWWVGFYWIPIAVVLYLVPQWQSVGQRMLRHTKKVFFLL